MCICNVNKSSGLINGTRVRMTKLYSKIIKGVVATKGEFRGNQVIIPRIKLTSLDSNFPLTFQIVQLTVQPASVMTINKSQCQTLNKIALYIVSGTNVFSHGQAYIGLSSPSKGPSVIVVFDKNITNIFYRKVCQ